MFRIDWNLAAKTAFERSKKKEEEQQNQSHKSNSKKNIIKLSNDLNDTEK